MAKRAYRVTAIAASAQLGGAERVLLDFAARAFEYDLAVRVITPREGPLIAILEEIGVPAVVVPPGDETRAAQRDAPASLLGIMGWARHLAAQPIWQDADVTYTVSLKAHLAVAARRKHPVVWHLHEMPPEWRGMIWRTMAGTIPDALIANSQATADAWGKGETGKGKGEKRGRASFPFPISPFPPIHVIPNGVDLDRFKPRQRTGWIHDRLGIPREHRLIGMPAVFARWKGQLEVLEAFSAVSDQFPEVHLVFVGGSIYDTPEEDEFGEELRTAVEKGEWGKGKGETPAHQPFPLPISPFPRAHLLPFQPKIELVYPELDLTLHYSLRPEPFGRVILEAMACGVPVIAADEGGPIEILGKGEGGSGKGGWLVPAREISALAAVMRNVLSLDPVQLRAAGAEGRRRAEDHYSARIFARRVAEVLRAAALGLSGERGKGKGET